MQISMDLFAASCENFGLIINTEKAVVMQQPPPNTAHSAPQISVNGTQLQVVDNFTYLGSNLSRSTKIDGKSAEHRLEPSWSPSQHEDEDVRGRDPADAAVWNGDLDDVQKAGASTQPLPPQLSLTVIEAEVARTDPRHGCTGVYGNSLHLRHVETTETALERPPDANGQREATQMTLLWRCRNGFTPIRSPNPLIQGHSEDLHGASEDQPDQLRRPRSRPTDLEEDSEDRRSDLQGEPHGRRERQTRSAQISAAPTSQRQRPTTPSVHGVDGNSGRQLTCWTPSDQLQHSDCKNRRLYVHLSLAFYAVS
ncbi:hypothetical protein SprV_0301125500 [Sparganum proliferum]